MKKKGKKTFKKTKSTVIWAIYYEHANTDRDIQSSITSISIRKIKIQKKSNKHTSTHTPAIDTPKSCVKFASKKNH